MMFEKSLSQVSKLETDLAQGKQDLETFKADGASARGRLSDILADCDASKAAITRARKALSDLGAAIQAKEAEITDLERAIPKAREAAIEKAKEEFTTAAQTAMDATDIPKEEMLAAIQTVIDLADRTQAAWRNYSGITCAWMEHFPDIPMPAHAQAPEKRLNAHGGFIDAAKRLNGIVDYMKSFL